MENVGVYDISLLTPKYRKTKIHMNKRATNDCSRPIHNPSIATSFISPAPIEPGLNMKIRNITKAGIMPIKYSGLNSSLSNNSI
ncbi:hypothetical protein GCM10010912_58420 [Paenibacillus albidus]|uniref:Uncharacterized protein n=1 Tax=Paenibacillus albidus TaxID=2041023 RepID=A0A917CZT3_9BACL|nr:hypothetical protein GCM10010912_58420 [Paenibacillus albidus]